MLFHLNQFQMKFKNITDFQIRDAVHADYSP
jgi:hypothetical protein